MAGKPAPVYQITGAADPLSVEQSGRQRVYLISMGIRTLCFLGAIIIGGPLRWVLVLGAVGLPYIAVILANAGKERQRNAASVTVRQVNRAALPPGPTDH